MGEPRTVDVALFRALHLATRHVTAGVEQQLQAAAGVSLSEYEILSALAQSADHRARPREIGDMLGWEKSRTSHQVTRMQKRGLLERQECPVDMRGSWVVLTAAGAQAATAAQPAYAAAVEEQFGSLSSREEREHLAWQLLELGREASPSTCQSEVAALADSLDRVSPGRTGF